MVSTPGSALRAAVQSAAGSSGSGSTGVSAATPNTVVQRDAAGRAQVVAPSADLDIANKAHVTTAVSDRLPTSQKGVASGVASLDATGRLNTNEVPTFLGRSLGSGTSLPSARRGDVFTHTGMNSLLIHDGITWSQAGRAEVANRAARDTLRTQYSTVLPEGLTVLQADKGYRWRWTPGGWVYAGFAGEQSLFGGNGAPSTVAGFYRNNQPFAHGQSSTFTGWAFNNIDASTTLPEWISFSSNGNFTINDRCNVAIQAFAQSDSNSPGMSLVAMVVPGGDRGMPTTAIRDTASRAAPAPGYGSLSQTLNWTGPAEPGSFANFQVLNFSTVGATVNYTSYISFSILPA